MTKRAPKNTKRNSRQARKRPRRTSEKRASSLPSRRVTRPIKRPVTSATKAKLGLRRYKGHTIELRQIKHPAALSGHRPPPPTLLIDGQPVSYGQLPEGRFALDEYAYDWRDDLTSLARAFIDHRERTRRANPKRQEGRKG